MSKGKKKSSKKAAPPPTSGKRNNVLPKKYQFSMAEEARNTDHSHDKRFPNRRLDKRTMDFISAGSAFDQDIAQPLSQNPPMTIPSRPSSPSSVSSEEVVLFTGRNKPAHSRPVLAPQRLEDPSRSPEHVQATLTNQSFVSRKSVASATASVTYKFSASRPLDLSDDEDDITEEMLADYIANMDSSLASSSTDSIKGNGVDKGKKPARVFKATPSQSESTSRPAAESTNTINTLTPSKAEANTSTTHDTTHSTNHTRSITTILSQRNGDAGMFYLVVYDNRDDDTAEWVESDCLHNMTESALQFFESPMWETEDSESIDSEIQAERDLAAMFGDELIEEEHFKRKQANMTDEEIARRLAKQQEFGIDDAEVVMFDGLESPIESVEYLRQEAVRYSTSSKKTRHYAASEESDFDLMDFERPSLQKSKKKSKAPQFGAADSDLERNLQAMWQNDRTKKKNRKQEREELRAQGLLGGGAKAKYPDGIALDELKEEFKAFMASERMTMLLPPMDKTDRKMVHEIAHIFNVKSTSQGAGHNRHATLNKKVRSRPFSDAAFDGIVSRLLRQYRTSTLGGSKHKSSQKQFGYRAGEVVGSGAPELGSDNRGRAMLEKMGWSTGGALGAENNPGILNPIAHVVRGPRTGLG